MADQLASSAASSLATPPCTLASSQSSYTWGCMECGPGQDPQDEMHPCAVLHPCIECKRQFCSMHLTEARQCSQCHGSLLERTMTGHVQLLIPTARQLHRDFQMATDLGLCCLDCTSAAAAARVTVSRFLDDKSNDHQKQGICKYCPCPLQHGAATCRSCSHQVCMGCLTSQGYHGNCNMCTVLVNKVKAMMMHETLNPQLAALQP